MGKRYVAQRQMGFARRQYSPWNGDASRSTSPKIGAFTAQMERWAVFLVWYKLRDEFEREQKRIAMLNARTRLHKVLMPPNGAVERREASASNR